ncbi:MAG: respiratory nitrate reductase subunit beta [Gammaproteobacteria bacterium]|jgi:ethylbenzene hydroxylase subunit beta/complex iron-sulfur molybdoenzyme family reductase subunit beta|nr:respiratory nitrate reductase subunit beta [Gammaproteobacteria bacterium]
MENQSRQIAMVFDLNKCIGCQTCSVACKVLWSRDEGSDYHWWCTVNTIPGKGSPKDWEKMGGGYDKGKLILGHVPEKEEYGGGWDFNYNEVFYGEADSRKPLRVVGEQPTWGPNWDEDQGGGQYPNSYYYYLPRLCNHCTHPACVEACPSGAMSKRTQDGIVVRDDEKCQGDRKCAAACPYKKIYFNYQKGISQHCIMCYPRLEDGVAPACARQCPGRLVFVGYLDDENGPIHKLVNQWKVAVPLHPEYGTQPNIFYVPPIAPKPINEDGSINEDKNRIPAALLEEQFGPDVHQALATLQTEMKKTKEGGQSDLMDLLIAYEWKELFSEFTVDPVDIEQAGQE